jgi:hypothetical protein
MRLLELCQQDVGVDVSDDLPSGDKVTLVNQDVCDSPCGLRGYVQLGGFDAAVSAREGGP